jgi:hydroxylamine dehydrogenase
MRTVSGVLQLLLSGIILCLLPSVGFSATGCVDCHGKETPGIVTDWKASKHGAAKLDCATCHGSGHSSADDVASVSLPTPETCAACHSERVKQYKNGKHGFA